MADYYVIRITFPLSIRVSHCIYSLRSLGLSAPEQIAYYFYDLVGSTNISGKVCLCLLLAIELFIKRQPEPLSVYVA